MPAELRATMEFKLQEVAKFWNSYGSHGLRFLLEIANIHDTSGDLFSKVGETNASSIEYQVSDPGVLTRVILGPDHNRSCPPSVPHCHLHHSQ